MLGVDRLQRHVRAVRARIGILLPLSGASDALAIVTAHLCKRMGCPGASGRRVSEDGAWCSRAERQSKLMSPFPSLAEPESRRQLLRHLAEAAFLACMTNDVVRARRIAKGLDVVAPGSRECVIAYALSDLVANDVDAALERLCPLARANDPYGMAFQVLALGVAGRLREQDEVLRRLSHDDPALDELLTVLRNPATTHTGGIPANEQRV